MIALTISPSYVQESLLSTELNLKETDHMLDRRVVGKHTTILNTIIQYLKKQGGQAWMGLIWLRRGTNGGLFWILDLTNLSDPLNVGNFLTR